MFVLPFLFDALFFVEMMFFGIVLVYIGLRNKGKHQYGCYSSLVSAVQVFVIAFAITFICPYPKYPSMFPYPYLGFLQLWAGAWAAITTAFYLKVKRQGANARAQKENALAVDTAGTGNPPCEPDDGLKYQHEKARKAFHLAGFLVVASYFLISPLLSVLVNQAITGAGTVYEIVWGPISEVHFFSTTNFEEAGVTLTLFALSATVILVMFVDTYRLLAGDEYSIIALVERRAGKILRDKEKGGPGAQDYIAISSTCAWLIGMAFRPVLAGTEALLITVAAILISTLADGAAAIVGKAYGRHKVHRPHNQVKSLEGFVAGFAVALLCGMLLVGWASWAIALILAIVFLLIDYWSPPVADNAINAVVLTVVGCFVAMLI